MLAAARHGHQCWPLLHTGAVLYGSPRGRAPGRAAGALRPPPAPPPTASRAQQAQPGPSAPPQARPLPPLHTQVLPASLLPPPPRGGSCGSSASHQPQPPRGRPSARRRPRGPPPPGRGPTPASPHGPAPLGAAILAQAVPPSDRRAHRLGRDSVILRLRFPFRSAFRPHRCPPRHPIFPHRPEERER